MVASTTSLKEKPTSEKDIVRSLYLTMTGIENKLGGGEGVEGLYGSIKGGDMQRILSVMRHHTGLGPGSHLVDVGAGLGRPLIHALLTEGIALASGIEIDSIKCMKAIPFLEQTVKALARKGIVPDNLVIPALTCAPIQSIPSFGTATHAYSFWEGVPVDARVAFGKLFASSPTMQGVTVVQRSMRCDDPARVMEEEYGFGEVQLVDAFSVGMSGSGARFQAYIFVKKCIGSGRCGSGSVSGSGRGSKRNVFGGDNEVDEEMVLTPPRVYDVPVATTMYRRRCRYQSDGGDGGLTDDDVNDEKEEARTTRKRRRGATASTRARKRL